MSGRVKFLSTDRSDVNINKVIQNAFYQLSIKIELASTLSHKMLQMNTPKCFHIIESL